MSLRCLPSFGSIRLMVWEELSLEEFYDDRHGGHLEDPSRTILAILNLYVTRMPPIKFQLCLTYCLGGDVVWSISRWPPWQLSWISEWNDFSNSESLCHCGASHQVFAQSNMVWEKMLYEEFQDGIGTERFSEFWLSKLPQCLPVSFNSIQLMILEEMSKMRKANDGWTDGWMTDGRLTTGRGISWPGANSRAQLFKASLA